MIISGIGHNHRNRNTQDYNGSHTYSPIYSHCYVWEPIFFTSGGSLRITTGIQSFRKSSANSPSSTPGTAATAPQGEGEGCDARGQTPVCAHPMGSYLGSFADYVCGSSRKDGADATEDQPEGKAEPPQGKASDEATAAELLDALLTSFLPTIKANLASTLYHHATTGEPMQVGPVDVSVERKYNKAGYIQIGGAGLHTGQWGRKEDGVKPLIANRMVNKLDVDVLSVKSGAHLDQEGGGLLNSLSLGMLGGGAKGQAEKGVLIVEAELKVFAHFEKTREETGYLLANDQSFVGENAIEFCIFGGRFEFKHLEMDAHVRLWIDFMGQEMRVAFLKAPTVDLDLEVDALCLNMPDFIEDTIPAFIMTRLCASYTPSSPLKIKLSLDKPPAGEEAASATMKMRAAGAAVAATQKLRKAATTKF